MPVSKSSQRIAERLETIAMLTGILAGLAAFAVMLSEPTGWTALTIWIGISDEPWVMRVQPWLDDLATGCGGVSGAAYFWAKWQSRASVTASRRDDLDQRPL